MWLFCKSGFFSAVRHATVPQTIHLRARFAGDLERLCARHGIDPAGKTARQMTAQDYKDYDYLLAAERYNIRNMERITGGDPQHKIFRLLDFSDRPRDIADPWYTGDFDEAWDDIVEGCQAFLKWLGKEGKI